VEKEADPNGPGSKKTVRRQKFRGDTTGVQSNRWREKGRKGAQGMGWWGEAIYF